MLNPAWIREMGGIVNFVDFSVLQVENISHRRNSEDERNVKFAFQPFLTYLALIRAARQVGSGFAWRSETYEFESERPAIDYLLGVDGLRQTIESSTPLVEIEQGWRDSLAAFSALRDEYLIYP